VKNRSVFFIKNPMKFLGTLALNEREAAEIEWVEKTVTYNDGSLVIKDATESCVRRIDLATFTVASEKRQNKSRYVQRDDTLYLPVERTGKEIVVLRGACPCGNRLGCDSFDEEKEKEKRTWSDQIQTHLEHTHWTASRYLLTPDDTYVADSFTIWKIIQPESLICIGVPELEHIIGGYVGIPVLERVLSIDDDAFDSSGFKKGVVLTGFCVFVHQGEEHIAFTLEEFMSVRSLLVLCKRCS
jgi:hypothetical protein